MTGIITSLPPLVEQPPGNNANNPAGLPGVTYTAAIPTLPQTWTGLQTFNNGSVQYAGSISGFVIVNGGAVASGAVSFPAVTGADILLANNNTATITNKSIDGLQNTLTNIPAASFGSTTGTGAVVLNNGPTIIGPSISGATITTSTLNGNTWTAGTGTLTLGAAKTATISNTLTFTGSDGSSAAFGAGGIVAYQGGTLAQFAATTSAQLAGVISDETGTGAVVFANGPTLIAPLLGTPASGVATNLTGTAAGLTAGNVTTNANLTGPVTSVGNATAIGANQVTRAMEAQGIARSVIGVTGNATANVADIQGAANQFLGVNSAGTALAFQTMSTDATLSGGALTIAANAVTNAKMAAMAAFTFKGNNTSGVATPTDVDISLLTAKASPVATDLVMISDQAASGAWKKVTISSLASAGSVASIAGNTGAFTLSNGIKNVTNDIQADPVFHRSYLAGLTLSTAGSSATFGIAAGVAVDSTNAGFMSLASAYTKTTGAWAVGSAAGSLDTGSITAGAWYHVHLIKRPDTGVVDIAISGSPTAPTTGTNIPAAYTLSRRIGSMRLNGSSQWISFIQDGDTFTWLTNQQDVTAVNPGTAAVTRTVSTPLSIRVEGIFNVGAQTAASGATISLSDLSTTDETLSITVPNYSIDVFGSAATQVSVGNQRVFTNTSSQIRSKLAVSAADITIYISTRGWVDRRGRDT